MARHTYFLSDTHIGASYISDTYAHQRRLVKWLRSIAPTAARLYLMGDILDYWYEYKTVVPQGYTRFFGALAELSDSGVEITWLKGNHDIWIHDYLPNELGITVIDGILNTTIDGKVFVLEHGDGIGEPRRSYRLMRKIFRNRIAQWLYSAIHPRWTIGMAHSWSSHSRKQGYKQTVKEITSDDPLVNFAKQYMESNGHVDYFITGHRHMVAEYDIAPESHLIILGDGFRLMTYGVWDGQSLKIEKIPE
ncbi:MAG: UDP-2,3-diacylglucosamine diphosphatase [Paramuribaculum sp.]|nr:UDP-2,3-diacylglucosamine diphosphatase [Paramuribaculum sp.]